MSVQVEPRFLPDQSSVEDGIYCFAYAVTIVNRGPVAAQVISRHWVFADASGHSQVVDGLGVIGEQPLLAPGESFRYTSGCKLQAASGTMHGSFFIVTERGERFDIPIDTLVLEADGGHTPSARVLH
jgi:ApaG protein